MLLHLHVDTAYLLAQNAIVAHPIVLVHVRLVAISLLHVGAAHTVVLLVGHERVRVDRMLLENLQGAALNIITRKIGVFGLL